MHAHLVPSSCIKPLATVKRLTEKDNPALYKARNRLLTNVSHSPENANGNLPERHRHQRPSLHGGGLARVGRTSSPHVLTPAGKGYPSRKSVAGRRLEGPSIA